MPGTGKSANIYTAVNNLDLNVYNAILKLDDIHQSSMDVYNKFFHSLKEDMKVKGVDRVFERAADDAVLLADRFHDSHYLYDDKVGFGFTWMDHKGFRSFPFYLSLVLFYFGNKSKFRRLNLVFQTAWTFRVGSERRICALISGCLQDICIIF